MSRARLAQALPWGVPLLAVLAHAGVLAESWSGERYPGYPTLRSDTLNARKLALDTWIALVDAWRGVHGPGDLLSFLLVDLWRVPVESRALNMLDMVLVVWPLAGVLPARSVLAVQNVLLVALAAAGGVAFGRALGAGIAGRAAAGLVAGTSGVALTSAALGQVPQALIAPALLSLAGLWRIREGARWGVPLAAGGLAVTALLYWQGALVLALGWVLFALGSATRLRRLLPGAALAGLLGIALCLPAARPVLEAMSGGGEPLLETLPYGTPFPTPGTAAWHAWPRARQTLFDAISAAELLAPTRGWLVPLAPLLPAALAAIWGRRQLGRSAPWLALLAAAALVLGPLPELPGWPGRPLPGVDEAARVINPLYDLAFRYLPTASRMHHPMRWAVLLTAGLAALCALGADRLAAARPRLGAGLLVLAAAQAAALGPWPLPTSPYPGEVASALSPCERLLLPGSFQALWLDHARAQLSGVAWRVLEPPPTSTGLPFATPRNEAERAAADARRRDLRRLLSGVLPEALPPGACVVLDPGIQGEGRRRAKRTLEASFGAPRAVSMAPRLIYPGDQPRHLLIYQIPAPDRPAR